MHPKISTLVLVTTLGLAVWAAPAQASHSWGEWHWERAANPATLEVRNSTTDGRTPIGGQNWPAMLSKSAADWSQSSKLDLAVQPQTPVDLAVRQGCPFEPGAIRVCNVFSPDVTWLGLATVLPDAASGPGHLLAATAQLNDTWFTTPLYNATNAQQVMCQEVGHTFGLDHQDDSGADLNTCMDYADALDNPSPNAHDFQQIDTIYGHLDSSSAASTSSKPGKRGRKGSRKSEAWTPAPLQFPAGYHGSGDHGQPHSNVYVTEDNGRTVIRNVLWAY